MSHQLRREISNGGAWLYYCQCEPGLILLVEQNPARTSGPGFALTTHDDALEIPLRWHAPRRIFVNSMSDLFHTDVPAAFIHRVWGTMERCPRHSFLILTKRAERMERVMAQRPVPLDNVWLGVSVEDQLRASRINHLVRTPAAVRFLSCEPLLGPLDLDRWLDPPPGANGVDWVIVGGESGTGARPMHPDWVRSIRDQCAAADVPFFFKQWGCWSPWTAESGLFTGPACAVPVDGSPATAVPHGHVVDGVEVGGRYCTMLRTSKHAAGRSVDGRTHDAMPRVKEATSA